MLNGFGIIEDLTSGLDNYLKRKNIESISSLVGKALPKLVSHDDLPREKIRSFVNNERCIGCGKCYIACRDGGHRAISWDYENRLPEVSIEKCVGCGLCLLVQPVENCLELKKVN
jgi:dihydropyrimidine dehydrogenase (NAD+) subunit PreA